MANTVRFVYAQSGQYNSLETKDSNTIYFLEDTQQIYKGEILFSNGESCPVIQYNENKDNSQFPIGTVIIYPEIPDIKISDGSSNLSELPFLTDTINNELSNIGVERDENGKISFSGTLTHKLKFGDDDIVYDGSQDVTVPLYKADYILN